MCRYLLPFKYNKIGFLNIWLLVMEPIFTFFHISVAIIQTFFLIN
jgi:hypothetical protein